MLTSEELLSKIKRIQIKTDRLASEILSGEYKSAFRGYGLNFDSIREYQVGDDIRTLDWKVTARMQEPFVRIYKEERQLSMMLVLDFSASNNFGTQEQNKKELIIEFAAVLASIAIKSNDKVGMMIITDQIELYVPPKQGKAHIFKLIKDLLEFEPISRKTNLKGALAEASKMIPRHSVIFVISDFIDKKEFDLASEIKFLKTGRDLIAVSVRDPAEFDLPNIGLIEIVDPETGKKQLANLNRKSIRNKFANFQSKYLDEVKDKFRKLGVDFLDLLTGESYVHKLLRLFLSRERRN